MNIEKIKGSVDATSYCDAASKVEIHLKAKGFYITKLVLTEGSNISGPREYYFVAEIS